MNQQLKTRLVGALVLVSLAVIFIPMILDGTDREASPLVGEFMPDRPDYHFEPLEIPLRPLSAVPTEQPRLVDPPAPTAEASTPAAPVRGADEPSVVPPAAVVETKPPQPAPSPQPAPPPAPAAKPASEATASLSVGWVVQVGSFSQQDNALALRDRLRQQGFTAFVDRAATASGQTWRVRVGPELKRENAERQQQRLRSELQIEGIVLTHGSL